MAEYQTLTLHDKLAIAKDALRGAESDHYRRSNEPETASSDQVTQLEERIATWRTEVDNLEKAIAAEEPAPEQ
jgi:hypothetical protein